MIWEYYIIQVLYFLLITSPLGEVVCQNHQNESEDSAQADGLVKFPEHFTVNNRILIQVLAYNLNRIDPLVASMGEYRSMCEGGWDPTIVFLTVTKPSKTLKRYFDSKLWCYRTQSVVPLRWAVFTITDTANKHAGWYLANEHRGIVASEINNFDLFIYHEEDIMINTGHVAAYLHETRTLERELGTGPAREYMFGFQRYRRYSRKFEHNSDPISEKEIMSQDHLEEIPFFKPVCIKKKQLLSNLGPSHSDSGSRDSGSSNSYVKSNGAGKVQDSLPYLRAESDSTAYGNPHQAIWMLTKDQVWYLEERCNFFNQSIKGTTNHLYTREYMSSLSIFDNHIIQENCGVKKILPAERFSSFMIHHFYTTFDKNFPKSDNYPVFYTMEHILAGMLQIGTMRIEAGYFDGLDCWSDIVKRNRLIQQQDIFDTQLGQFEEQQRNGSSSSSSDSSDLTNRNAALTALEFDWPVLVKEHKTIFLLENGSKHVIPSREVFEHHQFDWEAVKNPHDFTGYGALPHGSDLQ